jgi:hypothetical protein
MARVCVCLCVLRVYVSAQYLALCRDKPIPFLFANTHQLWACAH